MITESLQYHIDNSIPINENVFRPGSVEYFKLFQEARFLMLIDEYLPTVDESFYLKETQVGEWGVYEGTRVPLDWPMTEMDHLMVEAEYNGREVELNKPKRGGGKKYYVYVKNKDSGNVNKVEWGAKGMSVGINDPDRRKSFKARHKCEQTKDKTTASYWACRTGRYPHLTGAKKSYTWW